MADTVTTTFPTVVAQPYLWPFDGRWSAGDTALLLLGFQQAPVAELAADAELAVAAELVNVLSIRGVIVVAVRRGYGPEETPLAARRRMLGDPIPERGSAGWKIDNRLVLPNNAIVVDIAGDNAFYGNDLEGAFLSSGIRNLIVTGLPTEGLVHATQRAANDMGFECLAISDACKGTSLARHETQLRITTFGNGLFGAVANSAEIHSAFQHL